MVEDIGGRELRVSEGSVIHVNCGSFYEYGSNYLLRIGVGGGGGTRVTRLVFFGGGGLLAYPLRMSRELR